MKINNMTPEERQMLQELIEWKRARTTQQIALPVDEASLRAIGSIAVVAEGTLANTDISLTGNPQNITVTVASGVLTVKFNGNTYNLLCQ